MSRFYISGYCEHACCWDVTICEKVPKGERYVLECDDEDAEFICAAMNEKDEATTKKEQNMNKLMDSAVTLFHKWYFTKLRNSVQGDIESNHHNKDVTLFHWASARWGPCFLERSKELREQHWDEFLKTNDLK